MADEKTTPAPVRDVVNEPAPPARNIAPDMPSDMPPGMSQNATKVGTDGVSTFEPDAFLAGKKPDTKKGDVASKPPTQIVKRGGVGFITALLMSTVAAGAGAYLALLAGSRPDLLQKAGIAAYIPAPPLAPSLGTSSANLAPLAARISALEAEILALKSRVDGTGVAPNGGVSAPPTSPADSAPPVPPVGAVAAVPADTSALNAQLQGIGGRVTAIETRLAALDPTGAGGAIVAGLQADIAGLKAIIATLQQQAASAPSPAVTFAVVNLAEAANRAGPFMIEYETVRAAMPGVPEVAALEPFARTGVATRQLLAERFLALTEAQTVQAAALAQASKDTGVLAWFRGLFADMVKVQPAATTDSESSQAVLSRAKTKLDQGDLSGCIGELGTIKSPSTAVVEWSTAAAQRVALESRISAVRGAVGRPPQSVATGVVAGVVTQPVAPQTLQTPQTPLTPLSAPPAPGVLPATKVAPTTAPTTVQGTNP